MRTVVVLLLIAAASEAAAPPIRPRFPLGKETTFVTGPLDIEGYVDYPAAINARGTRGLKPEDNAAVHLWRAIGPRPEGRLVAEAHFTGIGMKRPTIIGEYIVGISRFARDRLNLKDAAETAFYDEQARATSRAWTAKDLPRIAAWVKENEAPLRVAVEAAKRDRYFIALVVSEKDGVRGDMIGALLPGVQKCREIASLLAARALLHAGEGRVDEAWRDLLACHRLGRLLTQGTTLIEALVGFAIESIAAHATLGVVEHSRPDARRLAAWMADLAKMPAAASMADKIDWGERMFFLDVVRMTDRVGLVYVEALAGGQAPPDSWLRLIGRGWVNYEPALRAGNRMSDKLAAALRTPDRKERQDRIRAIEGELKAMRASVHDTKAVLFALVGGPKVRGEQMAKILVALMVPAVWKVQEAADRLRQTHENLRVALALESYHRAHGAYPARLADLAPRHIPALPGDLFSGKGLVYKAEGKGYLLYSVGPNEKDDGGKPRDADPPGDDIVIRMPGPKK